MTKKLILGTLAEFLPKMLQDKNRAKADRAMKAMMAMKKFDFAELKNAYDGK